MQFEIEPAEVTSVDFVDSVHVMDAIEAIRDRIDSNSMSFNDGENFYTTLPGTLEVTGKLTYKWCGKSFFAKAIIYLKKFDRHQR